MRRIERVRQIALMVGAFVLIGVILWLDISSGFWTDFVILGGLAAGLVTFLLTVLVLDRVLVRSAAKRWAPVNRLAFTEFLHGLADEDVSEVSRGNIVTRTLPSIQSNIDSERLVGELQQLRDIVAAEHSGLADLLSRWAQFLSSSGENESVMLRIAEIALAFDGVRDASLEVEVHRDAESMRVLHNETVECNEHLVALADDLRARLRESAREVRRA